MGKIIDKSLHINIRNTNLIQVTFINSSKKHISPRLQELYCSQDTLV